MRGGARELNPSPPPSLHSLCVCDLGLSLPLSGPALLISQRKSLELWLPWLQFQVSSLMDGVRARLVGVKSRLCDLARKVSPARASPDRSSLPPPPLVPTSSPSLGGLATPALTPSLYPLACPGLCRAIALPTPPHHPCTHQAFAHGILSARSPISLQIRLNSCLTIPGSLFRLHLSWMACECHEHIFPNGIWTGQCW